MVQVIYMIIQKIPNYFGGIIHSENDHLREFLKSKNKKGGSRAASTGNYYFYILDYIIALLDTISLPAFAVYDTTLLIGIKLFQIFEDGSECAGGDITVGE